MDNGYLGDGSILLDSHNVSKAEIEKTSAFFERALLRIPVDERGVITDYWRSRSSPKECFPSSQTPPAYKTSVVLTNFVTLPRVWDEGHRVNLSASVLCEMGDEFAIQAILHELAHVYFYARCEPNHWIAADASAETKKKADAIAECLVTDKMRSWGTDQTALLRWRDGWEAQHSS
jgi:hypothetical protein